MDLEYTIENGQVLFKETDSKKETQKKRRKNIRLIEDRLRRCVEDMILGKRGDC
ncbi:MAG: hypothetical protein WAV41_05580 [Microgenomates group bacterium]